MYAPVPSAKNENKQTCQRLARAKTVPAMRLEAKPGKDLHIPVRPSHKLYGRRECKDEEVSLDIQSRPLKSSQIPR